MRPVMLCGLIFVSEVVRAHGGGLDASGCHTKRATGEYHCHRAQGPTAAETKREQDQSARNVKRPSEVQRDAGPTCHVGPRGGTYTITPSGRKNYKGC